MHRTLTSVIVASGGQGTPVTPSSRAVGSRTRVAERSACRGVNLLAAPGVTAKRAFGSGCWFKIVTLRYSMRAGIGLAAGVIAIAAVLGAGCGTAGPAGAGRSP